MKTQIISRKWSRELQVQGSADCRLFFWNAGEGSCPNRSSYHYEAGWTSPLP